MSNNETIKNQETEIKLDLFAIVKQARIQAGVEMLEQVMNILEAHGIEGEVLLDICKLGYNSCLAEKEHTIKYEIPVFNYEGIPVSIPSSNIENTFDEVLEFYKDSEADKIIESVQAELAKVEVGEDD